MQIIKSSSNSQLKPAPKNKGRAAHSNGSEKAGYHPTHEEIAGLASQLYLESGCQQGRDAENWLMAERLLKEHGSDYAAARTQAGRKSESEVRQGAARQEMWRTESSPVG